MKNVSIIEVAKMAGVSKSTVSRVINNSNGVSDETRKKVLKAIEQLKYKINVSARSLRKKHSNIIGILISKENADTGIVHLVNSRKISGIVKKTNELGYDVVIFIEDISDRASLLNIIKEKGLSGIILLDKMPNDLLESFINYNIPFVLVNWIAEKFPDQCYVKTDLSSATIMALDALVHKGYYDIGIINWEDKYMPKPVIQKTFENFMKYQGLKYKNCVWNTDFKPFKKDVINFLTVSNKRAYISFSYFSSIDILEYCREQNIRVPNDIALISYEFFDFFDYLHPKLSGIQQQAELLGEIAATKLIQLISGEKNIKSELIKPKLVLRESC